METVEFFGEQFALEDTMSEFALMEFAEVAESGVGQNGMAGMAAILRLIRSCIVDEDAVDDDGKPCAPFGIQHFLASARKHRASHDDLIPVLDVAFNGVTERPTSRPSDSSDGPPSIALKSVSVSEDKGLELLNGRPDLQLAVQHMKRTA